MTSDLDVEPRGESLSGREVLMIVSGGIAAVESVKLSREIRRHGAEPVYYTHISANETSLHDGFRRLL